METGMSFEEFLLMYGNEQACIEALIRLKWPAGYLCPRCANPNAYVTSTRRLPLFECRLCRHQTTPIAGTVMEGSRTSLCKWFLAQYLMSRTQTRGISAISFSRIAGVTYKTAWLILHKIRHAISCLDRSMPLHGSIQAETELYARQKYFAPLHRHVKEHPVVIGLSAAQPSQAPYLKMKLILGTPVQEGVKLSTAMKRFAGEHIASSAANLKLLPIRYDKSRSKSIKQCWKTVNKWLFVTFRGIGPKHLQAYLDEFCLRLNLSLGKECIFLNLCSICANWRTITYAALVRPRHYSPSIAHLAA